MDLLLLENMRLDEVVIYTILSMWRASIKG